MLMKYDKKAIFYKEIPTEEKNKMIVMLTDKIKIIFDYYETTNNDLKIVCVDVYAGGYKAFDFGFFYFENDNLFFNMREIIVNKRRYKANRFLKSKESMLTALATIFKEIYIKKSTLVKEI